VFIGFDLDELTPGDWTHVPPTPTWTPDRSPRNVSPDTRPNLYVEFAGCWRVRIYGADDYDRMRGICLDGVVFDEFADFSHPVAWSAIARSTSPLA
jgi:hypothetical protein